MKRRCRVCKPPTAHLANENRIFKPRNTRKVFWQLTPARAGDRNMIENRSSRTIRTIRSTGASYHNMRRFADRDHRVRGPNRTLPYSSCSSCLPAKSAVGGLRARRRCRTRQQRRKSVCRRTFAGTPKRSTNIRRPHTFVASGSPPIHPARMSLQASLLIHTS